MKRIVSLLIAIMMICSVSMLPAYAVATDHKNYQAAIWLEASDMADNGTVTLSAYITTFDLVDIGCMQFQITWENSIRYDTYDSSSTVYPCFTYKSGINEYSVYSFWDQAQIGYQSGSDTGKLNIIIGDEAGLSNASINGNAELFSVTLSANEDLPDGYYTFHLKCIDMYAVPDGNPGNQFFPDVVLDMAYSDARTYAGERLGFYSESEELILSRQNSDPQEVYLNKEITGCYSFDNSIAEIEKFYYDETMECTVIQLWGRKVGSTTILAENSANGEIASCRISVIEDEPWFLSVANADELVTTYAVGEELDLSGLKLKLQYSDYGYEIVDSGYTISPDYDFSTPGDKQIKIYYKNESRYALLTVHVYDYELNVGQYSLLGNVIYGVEANTDAWSFMAQISISPAGSYSVSCNPGGKVGTGMTCDILAGESIIKKYEIAVAGDINGDGACNIIDLQLLKKKAAGIAPALSELQRIALHGSTEQQDAYDLVKLKKNLLS